MIFKLSSPSYLIIPVGERHGPGPGLTQIGSVMLWANKLVREGDLGSGQLNCSPIPKSRLRSRLMWMFLLELLHAKGQKSQWDISRCKIVVRFFCKNKSKIHLRFFPRHGCTSVTSDESRSLILTCSSHGSVPGTAPVLGWSYLQDWWGCIPDDGVSRWYRHRCFIDYSQEHAFKRKW